MTRFWRVTMLCLAVAGSAAPQAAVEGSLGASRAATTSAPAKGLGKSMSGLAGSLDKLVKQAPASESTSTTTTIRVPAASLQPATAAAAGETKAKREDPGAIEAGLAYDDLVRRFGPPSMSMTDDSGKMLSYPGKDGTYTVNVVDGKVKSIEKPKR
jgi:hypothetical protein